MQISVRVTAKTVHNPPFSAKNVEDVCRLKRHKDVSADLCAWLRCRRAGPSTSTLSRSLCQSVCLRRILDANIVSKTIHIYWVI